ncbi:MULTISPECIES: SRPBCC domain-containing protein [Streptomyces]|uniref:Carbon monoxide dehydrogenase subunit G n=1 Tax=Streptomyces olivaceus TaxID=47716 RepID=A0ABS7W0X6_STROV|nr:MULTISPECIES: SRPBCC domain-containing protein [Streptomyces]MBZ6088833.1 carbon monoxide dehydrogenase subunit G [Streptomyces olivaceus]MBZ6095793.1 carbon monoxide dehydrogenase subunit G [Streptomyces olivaceus]MBZ6111620.1 carbon monoxide dehydrogenase subunit G [Streptomyces olivaceus]MBZ6116973.1 carbon monoxide dehydrogenase subunit G [Streptomyces olivaceus]MBZ6123072.1 carbon monoxide dehydrogenase subunit G [Streptomyces olivaceus]
MEHEVFVPVPAERLRDVLADPARVARAVPGLQQDAGAEPVAGRLKVRIGSHSITYRGTLRLSGGEDGTYAVRGDATESRGTGTVALALTLRVADADGGSTVVLGGTATADGRVTELPPESVTSATARLLTRFAENLGTAAAEEPRPASVFDTEIPPPSLLATDGERDEDDGHGESDGSGAGSGAGEDADAAPPAAAPEPAAPEPSAPEPVRPPAEAAHARRTMIGRSAEEVDHAPPRGRYAPVPAPQPRVAGAPLRWAAPAAALVVASAIVVGRALRRRH